MDDLLARREANVGHLKRMHAELTVETERPAMGKDPARKLELRCAYTLKRRDRKHPDPSKRFDVEVEMQTPLQMHFKMEDGVFSFLTPSGKWVTKELPADAIGFLDGLSDRHAGSAGETRKHFDVKRLKTKDNFWGTKKGLVFVPKGRTKLYARREEQVDVETGQPVLVEQFDDTGKCVWRMKVHKLGKHNGMTMPEDVETESFGAAGRIVQWTRMTNVEVENEP